MARDDDHDRSSTTEALRRLEARLERASDAAERLIAEAAETVAARAVGRGAGAGPRAERAEREAPAAGWGTRRGTRTDGPAESDIEVLMAFLQRVRDAIPPDLRRRLAEALRELLLALRALIDWYVERTERRRMTPIEVEDIPIM
jgi:hypothetical protein